MSEIRSQATPARDELAEKVFDLLTRVAEVGTSDRNVIAHGIAMGLEDDGWSKPRTVNSAAELDALPVGSVVRELEDAPSVFEKVAYEEGETGWEMPGDLHWYTPVEIALPATVLFTPGDAG